MSDEEQQTYVVTVSMSVVVSDVGQRRTGWASTLNVCPIFHTARSGSTQQILTPKIRNQLVFLM